MAIAQWLVGGMTARSHRARRELLLARRYTASYLIALTAAAVMCAAGCPVHRGQTVDWTPLFQGIEHAEIRLRQPEPLRIHALRIDLSDPAISILVTPGNGAAEREASSMRTGHFLETHSLAVAVNASPFDPVADSEGVPQDIIGLSISRGELVSPPHPRFAALLITADNRASIATPPYETTGAYNAAGGFGLLLDHGENKGEQDARHPRTAAGVSEDGRYLYLVVIDGRQSRYSVGATTAELGEWMAKLGAYNALNLDGGGSSAMVRSKADGSAQELNRPIHNGIPGLQRPVANHIGVFAEPLGGNPALNHP